MLLPKEFLPFQAERVRRTRNEYLVVSNFAAGHKKEINTAHSSCIFSLLNGVDFLSDLIYG